MLHVLPLCLGCLLVLGHYNEEYLMTFDYTALSVSWKARILDSGLTTQFDDICYFKWPSWVGPYRCVIENFSVVFVFYFLIEKVFCIWMSLMSSFFLCIWRD